MALFFNLKLLKNFLNVLQNQNEYLFSTCLQRLTTKPENFSFYYFIYLPNLQNQSKKAKITLQHKMPYLTDFYCLHNLEKLHDRRTHRCYVGSEEEGGKQ